MLLKSCTFKLFKKQSISFITDFVKIKEIDINKDLKSFKIENKFNVVKNVDFRKRLLFFYSTLKKR